MSHRSWIRNLFTRRPVAPIRRGTPLAVVALEDRSVPAVFTVTNLLDDGSTGSLRWAVEQANNSADADAITFAPAVAGGTITLTLGRGALTLTDATTTTIDGGAAGVTLDASVLGSSFVVAVRPGATANLVRLSLTGSRSSSPALSNLGTAAVTDCAVTGNRGTGIDNGGTLTVKGSTISGNGTSSSGAGISNRGGGVLSVSNCRITGNSGSIGGGIFSGNPLGTVVVLNSTIDGNTGQAGGIYADGSVTVTGSTIRDNYGYTRGGGLYIASGATVSVDSSTIHDNRSDRSAGGVESHGTLTITASTVAGNSGSSVGGVSNFGGALTARNCTVTGNVSDESTDGFNAGGIYNDDTNPGYVGSVALENSLVLGNQNPVAADVGGSGVTVTGSMVGVPTGYTLGQVLAVDGNGNPLLADNGGPTQTIALVPGSPAIGAGPFAGAFTTFDQRGYARPVDGQIDIGAFQTAAQRVSLVVDTVTDVIDGSDGKTSLREAITYANVHAGADTITFAPAVAGQTITLTGGQLVLTDSATTTIDGGATGVTIEGGGTNRLFFVNSLADAALNRLTLTGGYADEGGGILVALSGTLFVTSSTIYGNVALDGNGGAISNSGGTVTVTASTLSGNAARFSGGGISNSGGTVTVTASTLTDNFAYPPYLPDRLGSGIHNLAGGRATLNSTIVADGVVGTLDTASANNLIVGSATAAGLEVDAGGNPVLKDNGGPTKTIALLAGSPALGAGAAVAGVTTDQRGRPRHATPDVGAYERPRESLVVTTWADEDDGTSDPLYGSGTSLREAVAYANVHFGPDTITFAPNVAGQTITLLLGQLVLSDSDLTTLDGGTAGVTIDAGGNDRVFVVKGGANAALNRLTLTGANGRDGGSIYNQGTLSVSASTITNNTANYGAGIFNDRTSTLTVTGTTISNNNSAAGGGGVYNKGGLTVTDSIIENNIASGGNGGGVYSTGTLRITASTLSNNSTGYGRDGGGIYNFGSLAVEASTITGNTASFNGGGVFNAGTSDILRSTLSGNKATSGGGIFNTDQSEPNLYPGSLTVTASTLSGNSGAGGGINNSAAARPTLTSTIVADGVFGTLDPNSVNNLLVGTGTTVGGLSNGTNGNIVTADAGLDPAGLQDNGGPTKTIALLGSSKAVGAGLAGVSATDQRGNTRNANPDIGAFETEASDIQILADGGTYSGSPYAAQAFVRTRFPHRGTVTFAYTNTATGATGTSAPTAVGDYTVAATFTSNVPGYRNATSGTASFSITPATLTITPDADLSTDAVDGFTKTYGDADADFAYRVSGLVGQDTAANVLTGRLGRNSGENVGRYTINPGTLAANPNYRIQLLRNDLSITPRAATWTTVGVAKTYGDADPVVLATGFGANFLAADGVTATYTRATGESAGQYAVTAALSSATLSADQLAANYNITNAGGTFTISPRVLTVTATAADKVYDGGTAAGVTLTLGNAASGETPTATYTSAVFDGKNVGTGKTVTVSGIALAPAFAANYTLGTVTSVTTTANVTAKTITGAFTAAGKTYDGTRDATVVTRSLNGVVGNDAVALTGGTAAFDTKTAGTGKTVTLSGATLSGADAANYALSGDAITATADVTKRLLTVTATAANKVFDGTTAAAVTLSDNRVGGDQLAVGFTSAAFADANAGTGKTVTVSGITLSGSDKDNYALNSLTATTTANITPAAVSAGLATDRPVAVPGLTVTFTATFTAANGAPVTGTVTFRDGATVLGTAPVLNGKAVLATDALPYGGKTITATFAGGANYAPTSTQSSVGVSVVPAANLYDAVTGQNALFVGGTAGSDEIEVKGKGNNRYEVEVESGCWEYEQTFTGAVGRVVIYGGAGSDVIEADGDIRVPVFEFGGAGNDTLVGAEKAPNVLVGGAGNDLLYAGGARDILIGGAGTDLLFGRAGDDILIGGWTAFDANESALWGVSQEWNSTRDFNTRVANLQGTGTGPRLNAAAFLITSGPNQTVFDDGAGDFLYGGSGRDWFFANTTGGGVLDILAGLNGSDALSEL